MRAASRAFTLVELLIVIAIISLLIIMLLPTLGMVRETLVKTNCKTNLRNAHGVMMAYASKFGGYLPAFGIHSIYEAGEKMPGGAPADHHLMLEALMAAGGGPKDFACPAHPDYEHVGEDGTSTDWTRARWEPLTSWKSVDTPGYCWMMLNRNFTRHPEGGNVIPSRWPAWSRYLNGKFLPERNDTPGNPPLGGDEMYLEAKQGYYVGFWHYRDRQTVGGYDTDRRVIEGGGGGHTLFLAGDVVWADWGEMEGAGPVHEANDDDYYYLLMRKPGE